MSRSHSPDGAHMRYECDGCDARASSPEGVAPQGWLVEFTRDLCPECAPACRFCDGTGQVAAGGGWDPAPCLACEETRARKERRS